MLDITLPLIPRNVNSGYIRVEDSNGKAIFDVAFSYAPSHGVAERQRKILHAMIAAINTKASDIEQRTWKNRFDR